MNFNLEEPTMLIEIREKHIKRRPAIVKPEEEFDYYEIDGEGLQEDTDHGYSFLSP